MHHKKNSFLALCLVAATFIACSSNDNADAPGPYIPPKDTTRNQLVYVVALDGKMYALNGADGSVKWTFSVYTPAYGDNEISSAVIANSTVYVSSKEKKLFAINALTGEEKWHYTIGSEHSYYTTPLVADGKVFVGGEGGLFYAINASTGQLIWNKTYESYFSNAGAFNNGSLFLPCHNGSIYAVDGNTGDIQWRCGPSQWAFGASSPKVKGNTVFAVAAYRTLVTSELKSQLFVIDRMTGTFIPQRLGYIFEGNFESAAAPAIKDTIAYVAGGTGMVYAVNTNLYPDDNLVWKYNIGKAVITSPLVNDTAVYVLDVDGYLHAIDRAKGTLIWTVNSLAERGSNSCPVLANDIICYGTSDGIVAVDIRLGKIKWRALDNLFIDATPCVLAKNGEGFNSGAGGVQP